MLFWGPICAKKGSTWATPKIKNNFFGINNKSRSSSFYFIGFGWVMNLFLFCVMFFVEKGSFPAKTIVERANTNQKWPNLIFAYTFRLILLQENLYRPLLWFILFSESHNPTELVQALTHTASYDSPFPSPKWINELLPASLTDIAL